VPTKVGGRQSTGEVAFSTCLGLVWRDIACFFYDLVLDYELSHNDTGSLGVGHPTLLKWHLYVAKDLVIAVLVPGGDPTGYCNSLDRRRAGPALWTNNSLAGGR
jgi:hypothetical protein